MDWHPSRSDLRFAFAVARLGGSLCVRGFAGQVREGLRCGLDQGDESRSPRPGLISAERRLVGAEAELLPGASSSLGSVDIYRAAIKAAARLMLALKLSAVLSYRVAMERNS